MEKLFLFSQNLKLESIEKLNKYWTKNDDIILLTTHHLFENEIEYLRKIFVSFKYLTFSMFLSDSEQENIDTEADNPSANNALEYYNQVRLIKNQWIAKKVCNEYKNADKYLLSNDLGIEPSVWIKAGFKQLSGDYYYDWSKIKSLKSKIKKRLKKNTFIQSLYKRLFRKKTSPYKNDVYSACFNGKKYIFVGRMSRVAYRINLEFKQNLVEKENLDKRVFHNKNECQYLSSIHERSKCIVPDSPEYEVRYIQDGYLPPNYSGLDLKYIPNNVKYYVWDEMGKRQFDNHKIPASIMPFRKKLYLPTPNFPKQVKTVLVATSGSGDWTAQKNRSDDDLMVMAFVEVARRLPNINIVYRAHPTWVYPEHVGVNSINRVDEYFKYTKLNNIRISTNIPNMKVLSFPRSSLEEDLEHTDIVFGEHSESMIDAGFKGIPFASVNLTTRRDFACGLTEMGFANCKTVEEICEFIEKISNKNYQEEYLKAVHNYNKMTDMD